MGNQPVRRPLPTQDITNTEQMSTNINPSSEWDFRPHTQWLSSQREQMFETAGPLRTDYSLSHQISVCPFYTTLELPTIYYWLCTPSKGYNLTLIQLLQQITVLTLVSLLYNTELHPQIWTAPSDQRLSVPSHHHFQAEFPKASIGGILPRNILALFKILSDTGSCCSLTP